MKKYRIGLIGISHWHRENYFKTLGKMPEVEITAMSDAKDEFVQEAVNRYGCKGYHNKKELLANKEIDVVIILGTHQDMPDSAIQALEAGKHIWVEKPAGTSALEVERIFNKAKELKLKAIVPLVCRKDPSVFEAVNLIHSGKLGKITHTCFRSIAGPPSRYVNDGCDWMLAPEKSGGGALRNLGIHFADLSRLTTQDEPETIYARISNLTHKEKIEDNASVLIQMKGDAMSYFEVGYGPSNYSETMYEIRGTKGAVRISSAKEMEFFLSSQPEFISVKKQYNTAAGIRPSYSIYMKNFLLAIKENLDVEPSNEDVVKALKIVDLAYKSAQEKKAIDCSAL